MSTAGRLAPELLAGKSAQTAPAPQRERSAAANAQSRAFHAVFEQIGGASGTDAPLSRRRARSRDEDTRIATPTPSDGSAAKADGLPSGPWQRLDAAGGWPGRRVDDIAPDAEGAPAAGRSGGPTGAPPHVATADHAKIATSRDLAAAAPASAPAWSRAAAIDSVGSPRVPPAEIVRNRGLGESAPLERNHDLALFPDDGARAVRPQVEVGISPGGPLPRQESPDKGGSLSGGHDLETPAVSLGRSRPTAAAVPLAVLGRETHFAPLSPSRLPPSIGQDTESAVDNREASPLRSRPPASKGEGDVRLSRASERAQTVAIASPARSERPARPGQRDPSGESAPTIKLHEGQIVDDRAALPALQVGKLADAVLENARQAGQGASDAAPMVHAGEHVASGDVVRVLTVKLDPPEYGAVHVRLRIRGNALSVQLRATDEATIRRLDRARRDLSATLGAAGYDADISVHPGLASDAAVTAAVLDRMPQGFGGGMGSTAGGSPQSAPRGRDNAQIHLDNSDKKLDEPKDPNGRGGALYV